MQYLAGSKRKLFLVFIVCSSTVGSNIPECIGSFKSCCEGYIWNSKTNSCEVCMSGFSGLNCTQKCPFPTYGIRCQKLCKCNRSQCDVSTGCSPLHDGKTTSNLITRESSVPIEKSTTLIPKTTIISSYCTSAESSTENSITLVLIEITGATGAILVFANIFLYIFDHRERKKITSTNQNCLRNDMIL